MPTAPLPGDPSGFALGRLVETLLGRSTSVFMHHDGTAWKIDAFLRDGGRARGSAPDLADALVEALGEHCPRQLCRHCGREVPLAEFAWPSEPQEDDDLTPPPCRECLARGAVPDDLLPVRAVAR